MQKIIKKLLVMNFKKTFFSAFICCLLTYAVSYSQNINDMIYTLKINADNEYKNLVGSPYINPEFLLATLPDSNKAYMMCFNAYKDEMEIKIDNQQMYIIKKVDFPITFMNQKKVYQVFEFDKSGETQNGFFVVLFNKNGIYLLLKEIIKFVPEAPAKSGYDEYRPPSLVRSKDNYYIGYKNNVAIELPSKKSEFYSLFGSKSKEIEDYAKENKLGYKSTEDLVKIFTYYSSL
jgi:hypothetical protein